MSTTVWKLKNIIGRIPGLYRLFAYATTRMGEGKVYRIRFGPMRGLRWKRNNKLSFWYHLGLYEPQVSREIAALLPRGGTFWDVGANAGYHTLLAARIASQVVAVEPDPDALRALKENLDLNGASNTTILNAAVSDEPGTLTLMRNPNTLKSAVEGLEETGTPHTVESVTLDSLVVKLGPPDLIKIDIEGAEVRALKGASSLLRDHRPTLLLSLHAGAADACTAILQGASYECHPLEGHEQMMVCPHWSNP